MRKAGETPLGPLGRRLCVGGPAVVGLAIVVGCALPTRSDGQRIVEDFDGGFSEDLGWEGDLAAFAGEEGRLVLRDARAEPSTTALVSFPAATQDSACWTLDITQDFSASASNRLRYWLAADRQLVRGDAAGYYLQFGGISGGDDALEVFYENGSTRTLVAAGTAGLAAADPLELSVRVCAGADRGWTLAARDPAGAIVDTASGTGPVELAGAHVGLAVRFTATRNGLLSVDDLSVGPAVVDTEAPRLVLAQAEGQTTVVLVASEALSEESLEAGNYRVGGSQVTSVSTSDDTVRLALSTPLPDEIPTEVSIGGWRDAAGNVSGPFTATVTYVPPRQLARYEVLITEVMADPTPAIGLPEAEYVEVYNAGAAAVDLATVSLATPRTAVALPDTLLPPGAYLALAGADVSDGRFADFRSLPALTNSGTTLRLLTEGGRVIDEVAYDDALLPPGKRDGGYSLERVDLGVPCAPAADNLAASVALAGGTPGVVNSVAGRIERRPLRLTSVVQRGTDTVIVRTNRALDGDIGLAFLIDGRVGAEATAGESFGAYVLALDEPLAAGRIVEVALSSDARSCAVGEAVDGGRLATGIPESSTPGDWQLNEIMYDPLSGQGRWVELVNVSDRLLSLNDLLLTTADAAGASVDAFALEAPALVRPGGFLVVAADVASLLLQYPNAEPSAVVGADVPTLGDEACLSLVDAAAGERYFLVCYSEDWHNGAFAKTDGVSLERIDLAAPASDGGNWTSAASTVDFGTPTLPNSQARVEERDGGGAVSLQRERMSPDGDGFEDLLLVDYDFGEPGTLVTFEVVDLQGRSVFRPEEQEAVGGAGTWTWDGVTDGGGVVARGTYVLRVEWFGEGRVAERAYLAFGVVGR